METALSQGDQAAPQGVRHGLFGHVQPLREGGDAGDALDQQTQDPEVQNVEAAQVARSDRVSALVRPNSSEA